MNLTKKPLNNELIKRLKLNIKSTSNIITTMEYSLISKELTSKLSKIVKKNNGIYFTPPSCVNNNIKLLEPHFKKIINVLEPSCGSCDYITALHK